MSWTSKVAWSEGLFLRPQHLQQADRYVEHLVEARVRPVTPYPWGFSVLEIDHDLAQQGRFGLRRAAGILPDGTPFDVPGHAPLPAPVEVPEGAGQHLLWLTLPVAAANTRELDAEEADTASRYVHATELLIDSTAPLRVEEEIEIAHPRLALDLRRTAKPGYVVLPVARVLEVRDHTVVLDERFVPPVLSCAAHPVADGWIDRVVGWIETRLDELARYAADPTAGGGLQSADYFVLQLLNRHLPVLRHFRASRCVHPERLYEEFLRIAGELATFATIERRARAYPVYNQNDLEGVFGPLLRDIQDFLSAQIGRRAIRLEIVERAPNAFVSTIRDRNLFRNANLVLEVSARRPLTEIQAQFPHLFKIGPNTKMNEIVHAHLPGVGLVHLPTPPPQIRAMADHVYFLLDRQSPLWPEFSVASSLGMHFSGDWPDLALELWAVLEGRR
ncbi:type VI secretion system baseplate subunit TssK [Methylobacterium nodulans]|uniref:Type VI secretion protein, VC_A0114 family n=1 Tax=Methylobacterium nodulans (strain LMG 21967 / CNCM I-2342 / ORS 2060) TaxID=460265 RepID=B8IIB8_METNO|nr:type VI secretion system baseplate subunit TssK [Methylobacterium nodulans]ACL57987.1 type VI secretion protein, VC_A0114 family [Methylobacterium nodulans ORS 2060]